MRRALVLALLLSLPPAAAAVDSDFDGVDDAVDNCPFVANPRVLPPLPGQTTLGGQPDDDLDGTGNACDCDFTGEGFCNIDDFIAFLPEFIAGVPSPGSGTDMTGDGFVNIDDFVKFVQGFQAGLPGPSCGEPCDALQLGCSGPACPAGPNPVCAQAAAALCLGQDVPSADDLLVDCLEGLNVADPGVPPAGSALSFGAAATFRGFTGALRPLIEQPADGDPATVDTIREVLDALGFTEEGRSPLEWFARRDLGPAGSFPPETCVVPEGTLDAADFQAAAETDLLPALDRALAELAALEAILPAWDGSCDVPTDLGPLVTLEFDETDALALRAALHALRGWILWAISFDAEIDFELACQIHRLGPLGGIEQILAENPNLLEFLDGNQKALPALDDFLWSAALTKAALDSALAELDDPIDDFLSIRFDLPGDEQALRDRLQRIEDSLVGPTHFPNLGLCGDPFVDAGLLFETAPRDLLPPFVGNEPQYEQIADPTLGGILTPFTHDDLVCSLDDEPPVITLTTADGNPGAFDFLDFEIHVMDLPSPAGAGPDPASLEVYIDAFACPLTIDGVPLAGGNVAPLFAQTTEPDGTLVLSGRIEPVSPGDCNLFVSAFAADLNANPGYAFGGFGIVGGDLLLTGAPVAFSGPLPTPVALDLSLVARPGGSIDPDSRAVILNHFGCVGLTLGGTPVPAGPGIDAAGFFAEDGDASDDVRELTAVADITDSFWCQLNLCVDDEGPDTGVPDQCVFFSLAP